MPAVYQLRMFFIFIFTTSVTDLTWRAGLGLEYPLHVQMDCRQNTLPAGNVSYRLAGVEPL